jgi:hypothetical protein
MAPLRRQECPVCHSKAVTKDSRAFRCSECDAHEGRSDVGHSLGTPSHDTDVWSSVFGAELGQGKPWIPGVARAALIGGLGGLCFGTSMSVARRGFAYRQIGTPADHRPRFR